MNPRAGTRGPRVCKKPIGSADTPENTAKLALSSWMDDPEQVILTHVWGHSPPLPRDPLLPGGLINSRNDAGLSPSVSLLSSSSLSSPSRSHHLVLDFPSHLAYSTIGSSTVAAFLSLILIFCLPTIPISISYPSSSTSATRQYAFQV